MGNEKFYVDQRVGCVAVRKFVKDDISPGLNSDLPDVVAYWGDVKQSDVESARRVCEMLNFKFTK